MQEIDRLLSEEELFARLDWFIRLRWLFLLGLSLMVAVASQLPGITLPYRQILEVGGAILAYNTALYLYHSFFTRKRPPHIPPPGLRPTSRSGWTSLH